jgi:hypothetical protein
MTVLGFLGRIKNMVDSDASLHSMFYEQFVEHVFVAEVLQEVWYRFKKPVEVLRSEKDSYGYDLVFECDGVVRHVQLKTSPVGGTTKKQNVNLLLAAKPGGCVVWIIRHEDPKTCRMKLTYRFFGSEPRKPLPSLEAFKVAKTTKRNKEGKKTERAGLKVIPWAQFRDIKTTKELVFYLFGLSE